MYFVFGYYGFFTFINVYIQTTLLTDKPQKHT